MINNVFKARKGSNFLFLLSTVQLQYYIDPVDVNFFIRNYEDFNSNSNIIRTT